MLFVIFESISNQGLDCLVHPLVRRQRTNFYLSRFRVHNDHSNNLTKSNFIREVFQIEDSDEESVKSHLHWWSISNRGFRWSRHPSLESRQNINFYPARVSTGAQLFWSLYSFRNPNDHSKKRKNSIFIGEVFQIEA